MDSLKQWIESLPVWAKTLGALFIGGFAGAAYEILTKAADGNPANYKQALSSGLLGGIVAVLGYLKPAPSQLLRGLLALMILGGAMSLSACGNEQKLARLGYDLNLGINQATHTIVDLRNQNAIFVNDDASYRQWMQALATTQTDADAFNKELDKIVVLDGKNKQQLLDYLDKLAADFVQNKRIGAHQIPSSVAAAILVGEQAVNGARILVASFKPGSKPQAVKSLKYKLTPVVELSPVGASAQTSTLSLQKPPRKKFLRVF